MASKGRGNQEGSIYQRKDGLWCGRVQVGHREGKRRRKTVYGTTREACAEKLTKVLRDAQQGLVPEGGRQTVGQFLQGWLVDVAGQRVRPRTLSTYRDAVEKHLIPGIGNVRLDKLTPQRLQAWISDHTKAGASAGTVRYARAVLRVALNRALRWNLVARNVATLVDVPRAPKHEITPLSPTQVQQFLGLVKGHRLEALFTVGVALGLREGEVLALSWDDVNLDAATLRVRRALQRFGGDAAARKPLLAERKKLLKDLAAAREARNSQRVEAVGSELTRVRKGLKEVGTTLQFVEPKSDRSRRTITMPTIALQALKAHRARQREERMKAGRQWREQRLVFATPVGTAIEPRNLTRIFRELLSRPVTDDGEKLPAIRFHDLRHTCATLLLVQGVAPRTVMETLGHSQISLTMDTYSHVMPALKAEAAAKMDEILSSSAKR